MKKAILWIGEKITAVILWVLIILVLPFAALRTAPRIPRYLRYEKM